MGIVHTLIPARPVQRIQMQDIGLPVTGNQIKGARDAHGFVLPRICRMLMRDCNSAISAAVNLSSGTLNRCLNCSCSVLWFCWMGFIVGVLFLLNLMLLPLTRLRERGGRGWL